MSMLSQSLHVVVNEKKSLPVVIETKNVPVRPSKQHACALELCPPVLLPQAVAPANLKIITLAHFGQAGTAVCSERGGREGCYSTAGPSC